MPTTTTTRAIRHLTASARDFWFAWCDLCQAAFYLPACIHADLIDRYHARRTARNVRKFFADNE